ncbi:hypothetical protein, partial [Alistipes finegoldii]|uniref:hypothetical protein n=1 Tax=Alistipes finegoldii TaxID=214856 RepID=UPI002670013E
LYAILFRLKIRANITKIFQSTAPTARIGYKSAVSRQTPAAGLSSFFARRSIYLLYLSYLCPPD